MLIQLYKYLVYSNSLTKKNEIRNTIFFPFIIRCKVFMLRNICIIFLTFYCGLRKRRVGLGQCSPEKGCFCRVYQKILGRLQCSNWKKIVGGRSEVKSKERSYNPTLYHRGQLISRGALKYFEKSRGALSPCAPLQFEHWTSGSRFCGILGKLQAHGLKYTLNMTLLTERTTRRYSIPTFYIISYTSTY